MNIDGIKQRIVLETKAKEEMAKELNCTIQMIHQSLNFYKDSQLAKAIRIEAKRRGGKIYILAPAEKVWIEKDGCLENFLTSEQIDK